MIRGGAAESSKRCLRVDGRLTMARPQITYNFHHYLAVKHGSDRGEQPAQGFALGRHGGSRFTMPRSPRGVCRDRQEAAAAPANEECSIEHGHGGAGFASTKSGGYSAPPQPTPRSSGLPLCRGGSNLQPTTPIMVCTRARADTIYDYRGLRPVRSGPGQ